MSEIPKIGNEFINIYSKENPILDVDDECYFMFTNTIDYHRPLIGRGIIVSDKYTDGMNKNYFVRLLEIVETPNIINRFVIGQAFIVHPIVNDVVTNRKLCEISLDFDFNKNVLKVEAFFVRTSLEKILSLRTEYIKILKKDIEKSLEELNDI